MVDVPPLVVVLVEEVVVVTVLALVLVALVVVVVVDAVVVVLVLVVLVVDVPPVVVVVLDVVVVVVTLGLVVLVVVTSVVDVDDPAVVAVVDELVAMVVVVVVVPHAPGSIPDDAASMQVTNPSMVAVIAVASPSVWQSGRDSWRRNAAANRPRAAATQRSIALCVGGHPLSDAFASQARRDEPKRAARSSLPAVQRLAVVAGRRRSSRSSRRPSRAVSTGPSVAGTHAPDDSARVHPSANSACTRAGHAGSACLPRVAGSSHAIRSRSALPISRYFAAEHRASGVGRANAGSAATKKAVVDTIA